MASPTTEAVHDFAAKLRQPSLMPRVRKYVAWQQQVRSASEEGSAMPETPDWLSPISINLDPTTACNYLCDHCIDFDAINSGITFDSHEMLIASLEQMISRGLRSVILIGGGEPTLYKRFVDLVQFLKKNRMQVAIVTNGARNDVIYEIANCLTEGDWVRMSLDSGRNDTFRRMHNPKNKKLTLESICDWVPRIRERNPLLSIGFSFLIVWDSAKSLAGTQIVENLDEIVVATKLARESKFSYIALKPFLERRPDGTEVMNPDVMENFDRTLAKIREAVDKAKAFDTNDFRVMESTNLRELEEDSWRDSTHQPKVCHMQAFRQVLAPSGLLRCPAYRNAPNANIAGQDAYCDDETFAATKQSVAEALATFDAEVQCANITCLYNSANWMLEKAINGDLNLDSLSVLEERGDFYL